MVQSWRIDKYPAFNETSLSLIASFFFALVARLNLAYVNFQSFNRKVCVNLCFVLFLFPTDSNTKLILSQSNGTTEKTSPKSAPLLKSPIKAGAKTSSVKNGTESMKPTNGSAVKKMEAASPPKVARSPSAKSITPPNKFAKTGVENGYKSNGIEVKNSQGDCSNNVRGDLIVDNGVVHSDGNCGVGESICSWLCFSRNATCK